MALPPILYVEDEADDVFFMRAAFKKLGDTDSLHVVVDGEKAIAYLSGKPPFEDRSTHPLPTVVLLDLNLPMYSGFEVLSWLRAQPHLKKLPVYVFSSSGRPEDRARAGALGANGYWQKPSSGTGFLEIAQRLHQECRLSSTI